MTESDPRRLPRRRFARSEEANDVQELADEFRQLREAAEEYVEEMRRDRGNGNGGGTGGTAGRTDTAWRIIEAVALAVLLGLGAAVWRQQSAIDVTLDRLQRVEAQQTETERMLREHEAQDGHAIMEERVRGLTGRVEDLERGRD